MVGKTVFELWMFGGNSNNGANCGLAYANSNNAWSNSNANISARLTTLRKNLQGVSTASWEITRILRASAACIVCIARVGRNNIHLALVRSAAQTVMLVNLRKNTCQPAVLHTRPTKGVVM